MNSQGRAREKNEFAEKGLLAILLELGYWGPSGFSELTDIGVSSSTLSKRLKQGREQGLWEEVASSDDSSSRKHYVLSQEGKQYYALAEETELTDAWEKYRDAKKEYELARSTFFLEVEKR